MALRRALEMGTQPWIGQHPGTAQLTEESDKWDGGSAYADGIFHPGR